jgi:type IV secretory pathway TraG/TraD family ATPase VirD4
MPATIALDEFSALGADNVLSLLARGREAGISVLLATQELSDLERAAHGFRDQVLGITALKLAHRQEVDASAVAISSLAGTERAWRETRQLPALGGGRRFAARGSRSEVERPVVHPNEIKRLPTGQLVLLSNVPEPRIARTTVRRPPSRARSDQTAPGVTR